MRWKIQVRKTSVSAFMDLNNWISVLMELLHSSLRVRLILIPAKWMIYITVARKHEVENTRSDLDVNWEKFFFSNFCLFWGILNFRVLCSGKVVLLVLGDAVGACLWEVILQIKLRDIQTSEIIFLNYQISTVVIK
jgi:hypothetical protein